LPPHPPADVFPMLVEDELAELAEDIKASGLQHPLVISEPGGNPVLVDGPTAAGRAGARGVPRMRSR